MKKAFVLHKGKSASEICSTAPNATNFCCNNGKCTSISIWHLHFINWNMVRIFQHIFFNLKVSSLAMALALFSTNIHSYTKKAALHIHSQCICLCLIKWAYESASRAIGNQNQPLYTSNYRSSSHLIHSWTVFKSGTVIGVPIAHRRELSQRLMAW